MSDKQEPNEAGRTGGLAVAPCSASRLTHAEEISMLHVRCYGYASRIAEMLAMEGIKLSGGQEVGIKHLLANEILANEWPVAGAFAVERLHSPNADDERRA